MTLKTDPVFVEVPVPIGTLILSKHLAGKHDQSSHGNGHGSKAYSNIDDIIADAKNLTEERMAVRAGKNISDVGDDLHVAIAQKLGLDGKPEIVASIDELNGKPMYRGLSPNAAGKEAQVMAEEYAFGDVPRIGVGNYGSGTYFADNKEFTKEYSYDGVTLVTGWKKSAKIFKFDSESDLMVKARKAKDDAFDKASQSADGKAMKDFNQFSRMRPVYTDWLPLQLMAEGYDGFTLPISGVNPTEITVVLNREALQVVNPSS